MRFFATDDVRAKSPSTALHESKPPAHDWAELSRNTGVFILAWSLLNACLNVRFPGNEIRFSYLLPSLDVTAGMLVLAAIAARGRRVPTAAVVGCVALLILSRLLRIADGVQDRFLHRTFNVYTDGPLLPDGWTLMRETLSSGRFVGAVALAVTGLVALTLGLVWALRRAERYLQDRPHRRIFYSTATALVALSLLLPWSSKAWGAFQPSIGVRIAEEAHFLMRGSKYREELLADVRRVQSRLAETPHNLERLAGTSVYLIFIESYGLTAFAEPAHKKRLAPALEGFRSRLAHNGWSVATGLMESPTFGVGSWYAHASLATGVRVADPFRYMLLLDTDAKPIARFFRDAGYRTVLVLPRTTRPWKKGAFYGFDKSYYAWHLDYRGPEFSWGRFPDQFVLDYVHRREVEARPGPVFVEHALVTSHAPWSKIPAVVDDWRRIGDGGLYHRLPSAELPATFANLSEKRNAYIDSVAYDLDVLSRYITERIQQKALVIVLGDHQPVVQITGEGKPWTVPVHVTSRDKRHLEPFLVRGYTPGVLPNERGRLQRMEEFLVHFLEDFSTKTGGPGRG